MKRIQSVMPIAILLLSVMVVFAGTAAAGGNGGNDGCQHTHTISGTIADGDDPCVGCTVEMKTLGDVLLDDCVTYSNGDYEVQCKCNSCTGEVTYRVWACEKCIGTYTCDKSKNCEHKCSYYQCTCCNPIPEFTTIAIPAVALLGLFAFYRRKQKK